MNDANLTLRLVGEHGGRLAALESDMAEVKADVKTILARLNQAAGGWKVLMLAAATAGALGALAGKLAIWMQPFR